MTWTIRAATDAERQRMMVPWKALLRASTSTDTDIGGPATSMGRLSAAAWFLRRAVHDLVDELSHSCELVVADHPDVPGEPLGFAAFSRDPDTILAVHVRLEARRLGLGSALMAYLGAELNEPLVAVMTKPGRKLLQSLRGIGTEQPGTDNGARPGLSTLEAIA